jgi:hypothetical protein
MRTFHFIIKILFFVSKNIHGTTLFEILNDVILDNPNHEIDQYQIKIIIFQLILVTTVVAKKKKEKRIKKESRLAVMSS